MSLGFENAGFQLKAAYDNWPLALDTYASNFDHECFAFNLDDAERAAKHISEFSPDILIGGPPCQDFSIAGKRKECERANLTISFARIVTMTRPRVMVMENVYNIEKSKTLKSAIQLLKEAGYGLTKRVLDASRVGVPQRRMRFFLIAGLDFADEAFGNELDAGLSSKSMTVHDYFGDTLKTEFYYAHPRNYKRRAVFSIHEPSTTIRRVNRPIPDTYRRHHGDKADVSEGVRPLTTSERAQIQTFPKDFVFKGSQSQQEHLIANAVPVNLAEYVAKAVRKTIYEVQETPKAVGE